MPASKSHNALSRQWEILKLLPARGEGISAHQVYEALCSRGYEVDVRTIQRDLNELSRHFPLLASESRPALWRWMENTALGIPGLEIAQALSLKMIEQTLVALLPAAVLDGIRPQIALANEKLASIDNVLCSWPDKVKYLHPVQPLLPPSIDEAILATVQDAVLRERQLEVNYLQPGQDKEKPLLLHPLGLVQRGEVLYLIATAFTYEDLRLFALHRIRAANMLEQSANRPADFSVEGYVRKGALHFGAGGMLDITLLVSDRLATYLRETPLSEDMCLDPQGERFRITARVQDTPQLLWWLLSWGRDVQVLAPESLREMVVQTLGEALMSYQGSP